MEPVLLLILFFAVGIPAVLTVMNILILFKEEKFKSSTVNRVDAMIFVLGIPMTVLLTFISNFFEWNVQLYYPSEKFVDETYTPISIESLPTFLTLCAVAVVSYAVLRIWSEKLPPVIASLCYAGMFLGFCLIAVFAVQMSCELDFSDLLVTGITILFLTLPFNYLLCSVRLIRKTAGEYAQKIGETTYKNKLLNLCKRFLSRSVTFVFFSFFMAIPLIIVVIIILLLFGQEPDSVIKMFTETAEWTLSQKIPPPRLDNEGHYLCTVAACGDEKVVKPLRAGKRKNKLIIVNRQLLVANAFEDLISERTPKLHKIIRKVYDKIGLPISKYITTKRRSNIVYFIMKPLEWFFVAVLYTFDIKPENRIHSQYLK